MLNPGAPLASLVPIVGDERLILARTTGGPPLRVRTVPTMRGTRETASLLPPCGGCAPARARGRDGRHFRSAWGRRGSFLAGDVTDGVGALESAARAKPEDASLQANLGAGYMTRFVDSGNQDDAVAALGRAGSRAGAGREVERGLGSTRPCSSDASSTPGMPFPRGIATSRCRPSLAGAMRQFASATQCSRKPGKNRGDGAPASIGPPRRPCPRLESRPVHALVCRSVGLVRLWETKGSLVHGCLSPRRLSEMAWQPVALSAVLLLLLLGPFRHGRTIRSTDSQLSEGCHRGAR